MALPLSISCPNFGPDEYHDEADEVDDGDMTVSRRGSVLGNSVSAEPSWEGGLSMDTKTRSRQLSLSRNPSATGRTRRLSSAIFGIKPSSVHPQLQVILNALAIVFPPEASISRPTLRFGQPMVTTLITAASTSIGTARAAVVVALLGIAYVVQWVVMCMLLIVAAMIAAAAKITERVILCLWPGGRRSNNVDMQPVALRNVTPRRDVID